jgi:tetratricopeptide (TPR) repeat protein
MLLLLLGVLGIVSGCRTKALGQKDGHEAKASAFTARAIDKIKKGKNIEAMKDLDKAIKTDPKYAEPFFLRGRANLYEGDNQRSQGEAQKAVEYYKKALGDLTKAITIDPYLIHVYLERGMTRMRLKDYPGAIDDCTKAIQLDSSKAEGFKTRGIARHESGDAEGAIQDYTEAIKRDSLNAFLFLQRAFVRDTLLGDEKNAMPDYIRANELDPTTAKRMFDKAIQEIATIYDVPSSIPAYTKAIKLNPLNGEGFFYRGCAYRDVGNLENACKDWYEGKRKGDKASEEQIRLHCKQ